MKKLFFALSFLLFAVSVKAQVYQKNYQYGFEYLRLKADSAFTLPKWSGVLPVNQDSLGMIFINPADSLLYYHNGKILVKVGTGSGGTTYIAGYAVVISGDTLKLDSAAVKTLISHQGYLTTETEPAYNASVAKHISAADTARYGSAYAGSFVFDTTTRKLTFWTSQNDSFSAIIPGYSGINDTSRISVITSGRTGNLATIYGNNGASTTFSINPIDSAMRALISDTTGLRAYFYPRYSNPNGYLQATGSFSNVTTDGKITLQGSGKVFGDSLRVSLDSTLIVIDTTGSASDSIALVWKFNNRTGYVVPAKGDYALDSLGDVTIASPITGNLLRWNGTKWVNSNLISGDIPALDASKISSGTLATARLGSGTASTLTYLSGNSSWQTLPTSLPPNGTAGGDLSGTYPNPALKTSGITAGTYTKITFTNKGIATSGTSLASSDVTTALGYTPYNPASYPVNSGGETLQSVTTRGATTTRTITAPNIWAGTDSLAGTDLQYRSVDTVVKSGAYYAYHGTSTMPDTSISGAANGPMLDIAATNVRYGAQMFFPATLAPLIPTPSFRIKSDGSWSQWYPIFNSGNLIGRNRITLTRISGKTYIDADPDSSVINGWGLNKAIAGTNIILNSDTSISGLVTHTALKDSIATIPTSPTLKIFTPSDANFTISAPGFYKLAAPTANRVITLPTSSSYIGQTVILWSSTTDNTFSYSLSPTAKGPGNTTVSSIGGSTTATLIFDGTNWDNTF